MEAVGNTQEEEGKEKDPKPFLFPKDFVQTWIC